MKRKNQDKSNLGRHACRLPHSAPICFLKQPEDLVPRDLVQ